MQFFRSLETGIITMNNEIVRKVGALQDMRIEGEHISAVFCEQKTILLDDIKKTMLRVMELHTKDILDQFCEL